MVRFNLGSVWKLIQIHLPDGRYGLMVITIIIIMLMIMIMIMIMIIINDNDNDDNNNNNNNNIEFWQYLLGYCL